MASWTIQKLLSWVTEYLTDKGVDSPRLSAELLLCHAVGLTRIELYTQFDTPVPQRQLDQLHDLVKRAGGSIVSKYDFNEYGGAPLLGVSGICIICHGASDFRGFNGPQQLHDLSAPVTHNVLDDEELEIAAFASISSSVGAEEDDPAG